MEAQPVKQQQQQRQKGGLLLLPPEIIHHIMCWLPGHSLLSLRWVCRQLREAAAEDLLWQRLLRASIPARDFPPNPYPSTTFRDLYITHHPYWFVPRNKIWISDDPYVGRIMLCKYDPRRGCIEGYRLLADRGSSQIMMWPYKPGVIIHTFNPSLRLWLDDPVLKLAHSPPGFNTKQGWWEGEMRMSIGRPGYNTQASFFLCRDLADSAVHRSMDLWPPETIPGMPRVRASSGDKFRSKLHKPQRYDDISQTSFRMRHWSQFTSGVSVYGVRVGEEVTTWSTLDPALYTPTRERPYQGIFVGDYAGHGCEFVLVMQTDRPTRPLEPLDREHWPSRPGPAVDTAALPDAAELAADLPANSAMHDHPSIFHGAIEAVKLTGDPNVPRGQLSFIAPDIGPAGFIRTASETPFTGARVVQSRGHVAARGFVYDKFIPSQLLLISHDRLAQYWVPDGHISLYHRVDIDDLMNTTFSSQH